MTDLRMLVRDRRTLITAVALPVIVMPLFLAVSTWTQTRREHTLENKTYQFGITGSRADWARSLVAETRDRADRASETNSPGFRFNEVPVNAEWLAVFDLARGHIDLLVIADSGEPPTVRIRFRGDRDDSAAGAQRMRQLLQETRRHQQIQLLESSGFPVPAEKLATLNDVDVASEGHAAGRTLSKILTAFMLLLLFSGGAVVANDLLAGEKERGTLETLLTTGAGRAEIVAAKHLVILAVGVFITAIQCANLLLYVGLKVVPSAPGLAAALPPGVVALLLFMFLPVAALVSGVLLLTSGYARSYKEAQLYFVPVMLIGMLPALAPLLSGLPLRSAIAVVPIANIAVAVREILVGSFDWWFIGISWTATAAAAGWTTRVAARFLTQEKLVTATETVEQPVRGDPLFRRQVLTWFAVLWAALWVANSYIAETDIRVQVLVNLVGFFFGSTLLILWRYGLSPRDMLALRAPRPEVWLGLIPAVPGGLLTAAGITRLADFFMPVSSEMLEEFQRALIPEGISLPELMVFLAIMPGVFEELAFRGVLLHGLRRRLHPVALALVVGLVFGAFHFALFRLLPTAVLGMCFATVTMLTGSIFPAMLWHAANNAIGVWSARAGLPLSDLAPEHYGIGVALLGVSLWVFWRHRTPYPDLRTGKATASPGTAGRS